MDKSEIENIVKETIAKNLNIDIKEISNKSHFVKDLNLDSLDSIEMFMDIEDVFDLKIPNKKIDKLKTVQDAIDLITELNENRNN